MREMAAEELYQKLLRKIVNGDMPAGTHLAEIPLANEYKASRLHVKNALQRLKTDGLIRHEENRGYYVRELPTGFWKELSVLRGALDGVLIRRAAELATEDDIARLSGIVNRITVFIENDLIEDGLAEVEVFYNTIYQIADYERITMILRQNDELMDAVRFRSAETKEDHLAGLEQLKRIFAAIARRDADDAIAAVRERDENLLMVLARHNASGK